MSDRCEKRREGKPCGYALIGAACPICDGRRVAERLPMMAPLPARAGTEQKRSRAKVFVLKRRGAA